MPIIQRATSAGQLASLVASDGSTGGFVQDSEVSTFARTYLDDTTARAFCATMGIWYPLAKVTVASAAHTGTTNETTIATVAVPAEAMGANGILRIVSDWTFTNSANIKTLSARLGGIGGTAFTAWQQTTNAFGRMETYVSNRNDAAIQKSQGLNFSGFGGTAQTLVTGAINTANAQDLVLTGTLANSGESITLEGYIVDLLYGA